jgi:hypothetical protein
MDNENNEDYISTRLKRMLPQKSKVSNEEIVDYFSE